MPTVITYISAAILEVFASVIKTNKRHIDYKEGKLSFCRDI